MKKYRFFGDLNADPADFVDFVTDTVADSEQFVVLETRNITPASQAKGLHAKTFDEHPKHENEFVAKAELINCNLDSFENDSLAPVRLRSYVAPAPVV